MNKKTTPQPNSSTEPNLESTTITFTLTADPLTPSGYVTRFHEKVTSQTQVEEEVEITTEEVEEEDTEGEEEELEEVAAMAL